MKRLKFRIGGRLYSATGAELRDVLAQAVAELGGDTTTQACER